MAAKRRGLRRYGTIIMPVAGAMLAVFGALWVGIIFPSIDKLPADYERTLYFDGTFSVMNPATMSMDSFPVEQTHAQEAIGTEGGALLIHEVRTVVNTATGEDISATYGDESTLAIDAHSLEFMPEVDERGRWGYWAPPRPLEKGDSFALWHPGAQQALTANYVSTDNFRGLSVLVFEINESDIPIGTEPLSGMELYLSPQATLWIEPSSGTVVNQTSETVTSIDMMGTMLPVQIANIQYAEETIVDLMGTAESARTMLLWFKTLLPWITIGIAAVLLIISAAIVAVTRVRLREVEAC